MTSAEGRYACCFIAAALLLSTMPTARADTFTPVDLATQGLMASLTSVGTYIGADFGPSAGTPLTFSTVVAPSGDGFSYGYTGLYLGQLLTVTGTGSLFVPPPGQFFLGSTIDFAGLSVTMNGSETITSSPPPSPGGYQMVGTTNTTGWPVFLQNVNDIEVTPEGYPFGFGNCLNTVFGTPVPPAYPCFPVVPVPVLDWGTLQVGTFVPFSSLIPNPFNPTPTPFTLSLTGNFLSSAGDATGGDGTVVMSIAATPEPSTVYLLCSALVGILVFRGRRLKNTIGRC